MTELPSKVISTKHGETYKPETDWLDPVNRSIIQAAVRHRKPECKLRDGRYFTLTYDDDTVLIQCQNYRIPFGTFRIKTVLDNLWLDGENRKGQVTL